jgi:hypothetical protein
MVQVCDGRTRAGERRSSSVRGWFAVSSRQHMFVEHEKKTFFSWLADIRSEDGSQGRCSCAFIEAKRRPLTVAAAKGTRAKRVQKPFSLGPLFSICLRRGAPERFLRFQMDTCVKRRMRQAIDFSHVDVCRHLERPGALYSYPTGDDVSQFFRCEAPHALNCTTEASLGLRTLPFRSDEATGTDSSDGSRSDGLERQGQNMFAVILRIGGDPSTTGKSAQSSES